MKIDEKNSQHDNKFNCILNSTSYQKDHVPWSGRINPKVAKIDQHMQINKYDITHQQNEGQKP
jgi:hypothetical protein